MSHAELFLRGLIKLSGNMLISYSYLVGTCLKEDCFELFSKSLDEILIQIKVGAIILMPLTSVPSEPTKRLVRL